MMKKLLPLLLALLLLTGCTGKTPQHTPSDATQPTEQQKGLYDPSSAIEAATYGAIHAHPLDHKQYFSLTAMGSRLLLRAKDGSLLALQGDTCVPIATLDTDTDLAANAAAFDSSVQGAAYYVPDSREVVLVNPQLQQTGRIALPEEILGSPCISLAQNEIYYCVPGQIRALNIQTGISRLIRSHSYEAQTLNGTWFDGELLLVCFQNADGTKAAREYISTQTGRTLYEEQSALEPFHTWQDSYLLCRMDGGVRQIINGTRDGKPQSVYLQEERVASALPAGGVVGYTAGTNSTLRYYDLASGKCTAQVTLYEAEEPETFLATEEALWLLTQEDGRQVLYRWDLQQQPVEDDTVYTGQLITAQNPDLAGLEGCQARADMLSQQYDIKIHAWGQLLHSLSEEDTFQEEYQVQTVHKMLDELEDALQQFPEGFLRDTVEAGWVHVYFVRSISSGETAAQYWQEGDCHLVISSQGSTYEQFLLGLAYAIDSRVLGNSRKFDTWNELNPEGFAYSYSYGKRPDLDTYLYGENSAFLTEKALAYPHDDRSSVFQAAMLPGGEELFRSDVMQAKLERLCRGIREAYDLEKSRQSYPWEQYLREPLAYIQ